MAHDPLYDAIIVGGGHNGLTAAAYLARAGLRVAVCERRGVVGGAAVTEELAPGFRVSAASYALGLLRLDVHRELDLARHGLRIVAKDPQAFAPLPDGRHLFVWRDPRRTAEELARFDPADAEGYRRWSGFWRDAVPHLRALTDDPDPPGLADVERWLTERGRGDLWRLSVAGSAADTVGAFFRSPEAQGLFGSQGIIGTRAAVHDPGTAWVLAYHTIGGELLGEAGAWGYAVGGMGALSDALRDAAVEAGAGVRTRSPVGEILLSGDADGAVTGVRLEDTSVLRAPIVLSNADPKTTFLGLVPPGALEPAFLERVRDWPTPGSAVKVNLAVGELPDFRCLPGTAPGPQHTGTITVAPSLGYLSEAHADAQGDAPSRRPFLEAFVQTAGDPGLAPDGGHVLSVFAQYAPARLGGWEVSRGHARDAVIAALGRLAPNLPDAIVASEVLGPPELEERYGLTGGNIFHGEMLPEHSFGNRFPYRTPVRGLYLCGSGARPGGGVSGAPGRGAALAALADAERP